MSKIFILSDQTRNYYGFVVLTAGIDLDRFKKNPICLYNHVDSNDPNDVVGKWINLRVENKQLLAEPELDLEEEKAKKLNAKVEKDLIKGASIRLDFKYEDVKLDVDGYEGIPVVTKCELMEASIVAIPNNKNAVRLYIDGKEVEDKSMALSLSLKNQNDTDMKNLLPIFAALNLKFSDNSTEAHAVEAINAVVAERDRLKKENETLSASLSAVKDKEINDLIEGAIAAKKLKAEQKEQYLKLAKQDLETTRSIIEGLQPYSSVVEALSASGGKGGAEEKDPYEGWTYGKFQKEAPGVLLSMREKDPAKYKALWEKEFPGGKFNG